ncbi:MAG TPA: alkaline phosphatase D family protein [Gemmatimonadota bacterium]|nr:alkaline phosphatase D family protein [Gemmatimonadota bacterium]
MRRFLRLTCALAVGALALGALACAPPVVRPGADGERPREIATRGESGPSFLLGPMVGHATDTSVRFWVRTDRPGRLGAIVMEAGGDEVEGRAILLDAATASTGVVQVDGLEPAAPYSARFELDGRPMATDGPVSFRTFPEPGSPIRLRIALVSCARVAWDSVQTIWTRIADDRPDVVLWLGDNNYFEEGDSIRPADWEDPARMAFKYAELRGLPTLQPLLREAIHYAIWDDHDYADGEPDRTFPLKEDVNRLFERFWANAYYGGPGLDGIYSHVQMGDVELFLTDDRFYRDPEDGPRVPGKTMLGAEQLEWLRERLAESTARLKIVAVGVQVLADYHDYDGYVKYPHERDELLAWIRERRIEGVVFVSGDRHLSELMRDDDRVGYPLYELTASPVGNRPFPAGLDQPNPIRLGGYSQGFNYGLLDIDTAAEPATLTFRLKDEAGREVLVHPVPLAELELPGSRP